MKEFGDAINVWPTQVNNYRQNARYEQQLVRVAQVLDDYHNGRGMYRTWDAYLPAVNLMSQLELFFFEEFERERKARKNA